MTKNVFMALFLGIIFLVFSTAEVHALTLPKIFRRAPKPTPGATTFPIPSEKPAPTPSPKPNPSPLPPHESRCENLEVAGGDNSLVPAKITLRARGSDNRGSIQKYRFYFGDGKIEEADGPEIQHTYEVSGRFIARVDIKDSQGNWKTSPACETTVRVQASPVESHKSGCSDLNINASNNGQAPSIVTIKVNGYDNKGDLQGYRLDFGNGSVQDSANNSFERTYNQAGTYTVRGYIKNSQGQWVGGEDACRRQVYVTTQPLTQQPQTGTPTVLSLLGLSSGIGGIGLHYLKKKIAA